MNPSSALRHGLLALLMLPVAGCDAPDAAVGEGGGGPEERVLIEGARIFDGEKDLGEAGLLLRDGRIERIVAAGEGDGIPGHVPRVDYSGHYLVPGLVNAHAHVGNTRGAEHGDRFYTREDVLRNLRQFQAHGVTTLVSLGMNAELFYTLRRETADDPALGAQLFGAGAGIGMHEGAPPAAAMGLGGDIPPRPLDAEDARAAVRAQAGRGVDLVKLWVDDLGGSVAEMPADIYAAAIDEAHAHGLKVAAHVHDLAAASALLDAGVDIIAHGVRDRQVDAGFVEKMRQSGAWYIPTVVIDEVNYLFAQQPELLDTPFLSHALPAALRERYADPQWRARQLASPQAAKSVHDVGVNLDNLRTLRGAGVKIGFGTDAGAMPQRVIGFAEYRELELMTRAGFTPQQAITVATRDSARLLGLEDRGLLQPGRRADFVVLDADPLADILNTRRIAAVWQAGRQVAGPVAEFRAQ